MNLWLTSDQHFLHRNLTEVFKRADGSPVRPFASGEECDEAMIERWNKVVKPRDHIYCLGDVTLNRGADRKQAEPLLRRLNGHKRYVGGNHCHNAAKWYLQFFEKFYGCHKLDDFILTHIPIAPWSMAKFRANIHGHVHQNQPLISRVTCYAQPYAGTASSAPPVVSKCCIYVNVSVEVTDYTPIALEDIKARLSKGEAEGALAWFAQ